MDESYEDHVRSQHDDGAEEALRLAAQYVNDNPVDGIDLIETLDDLAAYGWRLVRTNN